MTKAAWCIAIAVAGCAAAPAAHAGGDPFPHATIGGEVHGHDGVLLVIDFAELLRLSEPASTVIIGNAAIAAANLSDDRTLILTGRTAGSTNLIVLDEAGTEIDRFLVKVVAGGPHMVTVHQGLQRQTYTCTRRCDPVLSVGDEQPFFENTASQIDTRHDFSNVAVGE